MFSHCKLLWGFLVHDGLQPITSADTTVPKGAPGGLERDLGQDTGSGFPLPEGICNRAGVEGMATDTIPAIKQGLCLAELRYQMCPNLLNLTTESINLLVGMDITYPRLPTSCAMILPLSKGYLRDSGTSMALSLTPAAVGFTTSYMSETSPLAMTAAS